MFAAASACLVLASAGCSDDPLISACGICNPGFTCVNGECRQLCNRARDCGGCNLCTDGLCENNECPVDPCSLCTSSQVCFGQECLPGCTDADQCEANEVCFAAPNGNVCVRSDRVTTVIPTDSFHVSSDANVTVKGGIRYVGGVSSNPNHTVTPVIE